VQYASFYQLDRLVMDFISSQTGVEFVPVPVKGGNGAMQAVLGDQVDFASSGGSYGPHVEAGTLKLLGAMTLDRLERFPDVQSMKDFGWDAGSEVFYVISAPAGTPEEVVRKLGDAFQNAIRNETVQRVFDERFMREVFFGPDEVDDVLMRQRDMYGRMIKAK
jgi:tripartite-type tricarboxylate transporter receptor subunit TctC